MISQFVFGGFVKLGERSHYWCKMVMKIAVLVPSFNLPNYVHLYREIFIFSFQFYHVFSVCIVWIYTPWWKKPWLVHNGDENHCAYAIRVRISINVTGVPRTSLKSLKCAGTCMTAIENFFVRKNTLESIIKVRCDMSLNYWTTSNDHVWCNPS